MWLTISKLERLPPIEAKPMLTLPHDLRYATRQLRNTPGFTVAAVLTLALGVGATTAIFSVVYGLLLASLPFHDAARIVSIGETHPQVPGSIVATYPDYQEWKSQQSSFTEIAAYSTLNPATVSLATNGRAEQVHRVLASGNLFSLLGLSPLIGRPLNARTKQREAIALPCSVPLRGSDTSAGIRAWWVAPSTSTAPATRLWAYCRRVQPIRPTATFGFRSRCWMRQHRRPAYGIR
jgi:hypothetical protein